MNLKIMANTIFPLKKALSIGLILFFMLLTYTITKDLKEILIQKFASCGGVELIPIIKIFGVFPSLFLFIFIFETLINKFSHATVFKIFVWTFAIFYLVFGLIIIPNLNYMHMGSEQILSFRQSLPDFLYYAVPCLANWSFTLFYILSEMWGSFIVPALFWQFAYKATKKDEAKKFFGLYVLMGNIGVIIAGFVLRNIFKICSLESSIKNKITALSLICSVCCVFAMLLYAYSNRLFCNDKSVLTVKKPKCNVGIFRGLKLIFKSKYLLLIFLMLFGYGISVDFIEIYWQNYLRDNLSIKEYFAVMGNFSISIGFFTIIMSLISPLIVNKLKWKTSTKITPIVIGTLGTIFFTLYIFEHFGKKYNSGFGIEPMCLVIIGLLAVSISRSIRYSLFDSTKNLVYLDLENEFKTQGQATVESLGGRIGKSGSSVVGYILLNVVYPGTVVFNHIGVIFTMFIISIILWIESINKIGRKYDI